MIHGDEHNDMMNGENTEENVINEYSGENKVHKPKKHFISVILKIIIILGLFSTAFYFIYFQSGKTRAEFILSNSEITTFARENSVNKYPIGSNIYFLLKGRKKQIDASNVSIKVDIFKDKLYNPYKQINIQIEKDFTLLPTLIPGQYFRNPGKYKIEVFLDGNSIGKKEIDIVKQ